MNLRFIPLDDRAKDGTYHLLRTDPDDRRDRAEYCGRWNPEKSAFEMSCGCPICDKITHFARRAAAPAVALEREKEAA